MDSSSQRASSLSDDYQAALETQHEDGVGVEEEAEHIHMPNASYWPLLVGIAVVVTLGGVLFISTAPWITLIGLVCVLITMIGWAVEDPMAPIKDKFVTAYRAMADHWKYKIGQNVVDSHGKWLGKVQARFSRYVLVERGSLVPKVYYVPQSAIKDEIRQNTLFLTLSEEDLERMELNTMPADLYDEEPETTVPVVRGAPQFASRPLSPAETGHYNYGRRSPGINTDASGSYHRNEVQPRPADYVVDDIYTTEVPIPIRTTNPE